MTTESVESTLLTVRDIAKLLQVSMRQVWRLRSAGLLPEPIRIGSAVRWTSASIQEFIEQGGTANGR
ncbi:MAG: helix-turn-helix domain-containing protein [Planctomycetota bacterium]|nr:helix-turn-helix domain-containing protein [Planctomycetota bacterium]